MSERDYLTTQDVADLARVGRTTVYRWCCKGIGPEHTRTPGGHRRFARADVLRWLKQIAERNS